jgi:hypothetical protein
MSKEKKKIESHKLYEFDISEKKAIRISLWENEGKPIIDIRNWIKGKYGEFSPTRKGISVDADNLDMLIQCLVGTQRTL